MTGQDGFAVGVDLGTSNTVAVLRWPDGRTRPLLFDGAPVMPSAVFLDDSGQLQVGRDALRLAALDPARLELNPKRRIDERSVLLGGREVAVVDLLAAILAAVARAAVEAVGFLPPAALTYPASWGAQRREVLATAARHAGWPPVRFVPEPVAAARYFADVLRRPVPVGGALAVFDFGGGTLDVAVVRNTGSGFAVLGDGGLGDLGGLDVDAELVAHLGRLLETTAALTWANLSAPATVADTRNRRLFWEDVRGAKEMLSRTPVAPVAVPGMDDAVHLTREELERIAGPLVQRAVGEAARVIQDCGLRPEQLVGLFLVGGSSRLPLVARMLHSQLGIAPTVLEQPELPVAEGALAEVVPPPASAANSPTGPASAPPAAPVSAPPPGPVSPGYPPFPGPVTPVSGPGSVPVPGPVSPALSPGAPGGPHPTTGLRTPADPWSASGPPVFAQTGQLSPGAPAPHAPGPPAPAGPPGPGPLGTGPFGPGQVGPGQVGPSQVGPGQVGPSQVVEPGAPAAGQPGVPQPRPGDPAAPVWPAPAPPVAKSRRLLVLVAAGAALVLVVAAGIVGTVLWFNRDGASREVGFTALATVGQPILMGSADASPGATLTAVAGDRAYLAYGDDSGLHVIVHPLAGGDDHTVDLAVAGTSNVQWQALVAREDAVLVYSYEYSGDKPIHIYALDPGTGAVRWDLHLASGDTLASAGPVLLWSDPDGHTVHGLDPKTGNELWRVDDPQQDGYAQTTKLHGAYSGTDLDAPSPFDDDAPLVLAGTHVIQTVGDGSARVIDVSNGHLVSANHVAESTDLVVGSGDRFYVASNSDAYRVTSYSLSDPSDDSATKSLFTAPDAAHITAMVPCGDGVCVLDRSNSDPKTATVRLVDASGAHWNRLVAGAERLVPLGSGVIVTGTDGDTFTQVLNSSGEPVSLGTNGAQATGARVNATSALLFKGTVSTYPVTVPLTGVVTRSGKVTQLGTLDGVRAAACSWNSRYLVCPQQSQFRIWTFAS